MRIDALFDLKKKTHLKNLNGNVFVSLLKDCAKQKDLLTGKKLHHEILKGGLLLKDIRVGNSLISFYAKCCEPQRAKQVFDALPFHTVVSWTALISGYAQHSHGIHAMKLFQQMQHQGICPNAATFSCIFKACGSDNAIRSGKQIHACLNSLDLLQSNLLVGTSALDMYAKCGDFAQAQVVFDALPNRDVVAWTALIAGYAQNGRGEEALKCFDNMRSKGFVANATTFVCVLKACGNAGVVDIGKDMHDQIMREGLLQNNILVGNALVDMYAKCGVLEKAQDVFDGLLVRNLVSWTALIAGYAQHGKDRTACEMFDKMISEGIKPDLITFTVVLNSCSHSGMLDKGQMYFESMSSMFGIVPTLWHHVCMVDLYGRAGHFCKAVALIKRMPTLDYLPVWSALLGACQKWGNVDIGLWAFKHATRVDRNDVGAYISLRNIYIAANMQEDADRVEALISTYAGIASTEEQR